MAAGKSKRAAKPRRTKRKAPAKAPPKAKRKAAMPARTSPSSKLLPTGSPDFDRLLGGGIMEGSSLLILGVPHCGKKPTLMNAAHSECCRNRRPVIFVLTDVGASAWQSMMKQGGWDCGKVRDRTFFVDGYSQQFGTCSNSDTVLCLEVPFSLSALSIETSNFVAKASGMKKRPMVILHSISTLVEMFGEEETFRFLQFFMGKLKAAGATMLLSMQMGVHDSKFESMVTSLVDCLVEMKDGKMRASGYLSIKDKGWIPYSIEKGKLKLNADAEE
ncbi:KaiC [uncultured archaeon]|nr:KaiC [uncultured archaeon]